MFRAPRSAPSRGPYKGKELFRFPARLAGLCRVRNHPLSWGLEAKIFPFFYSSGRSSLPATLRKKIKPLSGSLPVRPWSSSAGKAPHRTPTLLSFIAPGIALHGRREASGQILGCGQLCHTLSPSLSPRETHKRRYCAARAACRCLSSLKRLRKIYQAVARKRGPLAALSCWWQVVHREDVESWISEERFQRFGKTLRAALLKASEISSFFHKKMHSLPEMHFHF